MTKKRTNTKQEESNRSNVIALAVLAMFVLLIALIACHSPAPAPAPAPVVVEEVVPERSAKWDSLSVADVVADVRDAVVHIEKVGECQGSGCIIDPRGIVFTAKHVTDGTYGKYKITLDNGKKYDVKYVYEDADNDVAFMQIDLPKGHPDLPYVELAQYDLMRVGDPLLIFGSPLGYDNFNTVSNGMLSAAKRDLVDISDGAQECVAYDWYVLFQSNSAAYPGNSGGPVFNLNGEVIGVLVAGMDAHLNYSVPVARFRDTIETVRFGMKLQRFQAVTEESTRLAGLEERVFEAEVGLEICFEIIAKLATEDQIWEALIEVVQRHPELFLYDLPGYHLLWEQRDPLIAPPVDKKTRKRVIDEFLSEDNPFWGVGQYKVRK